MRYRPFGRAGVSVSAVALAVDDHAAQGGGEALAALIFSAMEAGVNTFHIESGEPEVLEAVGRSLAAVERRLLFVSLRLGLRPERPGPVRDFSADALTGAIEQALDRASLGHLDLVLLDEPGEDELPTTALTALKQQRTTGRVSQLGVLGAHEAMDAYLAVGAFDVLAAPYHMRASWKELNRIKTAARTDLGVIAYGYFPEVFRRPAGAGAYAFLHETSNWTAEELCLAYALMEPNISTVLIHARDAERLNALAAIPDRDLPAGTAALVEMARFGKV